MADNRLDLIIQAKDNASGVVESLNKTIKDLDKSSQGAAAAIDKTSVSITGMTGSIIKGNAAYDLLKRSFGSITSLAGDFIGAAARVQTLTNSFNVMAGSADKGALVMRQLQQVAMDNSVLGLTEVEDGGKRLLAMGVAVQNVAPSMKLLGDIAGAVGAEKLPQLVTAFGQVQTKGRLMGQEILQFSEAGVPVIGALAEKFGVTTAEVLKMSEQGKISFGEMVDALQKLSKEKYLELAAKQADTFSGKVAQLQDAWDIFLRQGGAKVLDFAKKFVEAALYIVTNILPAFIAKISALTDFFKENYGIIVILAGAISGLLAKSLVAMIPQIISVGLAFASAFATAALAAAPWLLGGAAIAGLVAGIVWIVKNFDKVKVAFGKIWTAIGKITSAFVEDLRASMRAVIDAMLSPIEAFKKAVSGDFSGALDSLKNGFNSALSAGFSRTKAAVGEAMADASVAFVEGGKALVQKGVQIGNGLKDGITKVWNATDSFKLPPVTIPPFDESAFGPSADAATKKVKEKFDTAAKRIKESFKDISSSITDIAKDYSEKSSDMLDKLNSKLEEITRNSQQMQEDYARKVAEKETGFQDDQVKAYQKYQEDLTKAKKEAEDLRFDIAQQALEEEINNKKKLQDQLQASDSGRNGVTGMEALEGQLAKLQADKRDKDLVEKRKESAERLKLIEEEIKKTTDILNNYSQFKDQAVATKEQDEFQKLKDKHTAEMEEMNREHVEKMAEFQRRIDEEMALYQKNKADLVADTVDKYAKIGEKLNEGWTKMKEDTKAHVKEMKALEEQVLAIKASIAAAQAATRSGAVGSTSPAAGVQARADGGPVFSGRPYVVGERGPELFVPSTSGAIVPNGGGAVQIHIMEGSQVSVGSRGDIDSLAEAVAQRLARVIQSQRNGLATAM